MTFRAWALIIVSLVFAPILYFSIARAEYIKPLEVQHDYRIAELNKFMERHHFAKPYYIEEYIRAADRNHISFAVLPTFAVVESGGCRHYRYNNCWGWNSAKTGFRDIPEGIAFVSTQLANSRYYKGKTPFQIAQTYGPHKWDEETRTYVPDPLYAPRFMKILSEMKP